MNVLFEFYPYLSDVKTSIVCENKLMIKRSRVWQYVIMLRVIVITILVEMVL